MDEATDLDPKSCIVLRVVLVDESADLNLNLTSGHCWQNSIENGRTYDDTSFSVHIVYYGLEGLAPNVIPINVDRAFSLKDIINIFCFVVEGCVNTKFLLEIFDLFVASSRSDDLQALLLGNLGDNTDTFREQDGLFFGGGGAEDLPSPTTSCGRHEDCFTLEGWISSRSRTC